MTKQNSDSLLINIIIFFITITNKMVYVFWLTLLLILLAILIVKFVDFVTPIISDACTAAIKKTVQKYSPKPLPPKVIYNVVEKKQQPIQQYRIQLLMPADATTLLSQSDSSSDNDAKKPMPEPQKEKKEENEESTTQSQISDTDTDDAGDIFMYIMKKINDNKKSSVSANDTKRNCENDEHINELIKAALEKWMEEQKPKDTVQENIQKGFEKVDTVQKTLDPTMVAREHDKDTSEC